MLREARRMLSEQFLEALTFAAELHNGQVRKGTAVPYVTHLMSVCALVLEDGGSETEAIAALLHDAVEDQGGAPTRERIREKFGAAVVEIVDGCTDAETIPKPPWRERKARYLAHLRTAPPSVVRVSLADKVHNARSVAMDLRRHGLSVFDRFKGGREGTLWYYRAVLEAVAEESWLRGELTRTVEEIERLISA
ncbi:MAG: HD domain-containing protein [Candidatus Xenobia bacterium]